jgi:hypothetical protein
MGCSGEAKAVAQVRMKQNKNSAQRSAVESALEPPMRTGVRVAAAIAVVVCLGAVWTLVRDNPPPPATGQAPPLAYGTESPVQAGQDAIPPAPAEATVVVAPPIVRATAQPKRTLETRELVARLCRWDESVDLLNPESVSHWRQNLLELVQHGTDAVPAIREFLEKNIDLDFGLPGWQLLGYPSARVALFDVLTQIGGPEAAALMLDTLRTTAVPREIALLARNLEGLAPEDPQYRDEAMQSARRTLNMAASGNLEGRDVAPLFEVLRKYGGVGLAQELEQANEHWNYYGAMALAQLPEGAGVPSLIRLAQEQKGSVPLQMLAQLAFQYPAARAALLEQARLNQISSSAWPYLQSVLAGDRFRFVDSVLDETGATVNRPEMQWVHIDTGNQNFYKAPDSSSLAPDQLTQQLDLVDALLAVTQDPAASRHLTQTRATLVDRLTETAAVSPVAQFPQ